MTICFAILALVFSITGIYGVVSRSVAGRTREFGIRKALGALDQDLAGAVLRQGLLLGLIGGTLGIGLALPVTRAIESMLWGVGRLDPATLLGVAVFLGLTSLVAAIGPSLPVRRVDPMEALRAE